jgi:hypothetical protein
MESGLRKGGGGMNNYEVFETLSSMKPRCKFTNKLYNDLLTDMTPRTMFEFALSKDISCSVCRYIQHDEYLGMFSLIINESIPLLFTRFMRFDEIFKNSKFVYDHMLEDEVAKDMKK